MGWKKFVLLYVVLTFSSCVGRDCIHVSPNGDDSAPGTRMRPMKTLQAACDKASGMTCGKKVLILLDEGQYQILEPVTISSVPASGMTVRGSGQGKTVINGGMTLPPFEHVSDSLWTIDLSGRGIDAIQQLYVSGERAVLARTPNGFKHFKTGEIDEEMIADGLARDIVKLPAEAVEALSAVPANSPVSISLLYEWMLTRRKVEKLDLKDSTVSIVCSPFAQHHRVCSQFMFENDISFLDDAGEWFYDRVNSKLMYIPREGERIEEAEAVIPVSEVFLNLHGDAGHRLRNVSFEGISWKYALRAEEEYGPGCQAASDVDASVNVAFADSIIFKDCEIAHTGGTALWFREACLDCSMTSCYVHDIGASGVNVGDLKVPEDVDGRLTRNITIVNNVIRDGGRYIAPGVGVSIFQSSDNLVSHNDISDFRYTGISVGWIWQYVFSPSKRNLILDNHIHHLGWGALSDMAGIYTLGESEGTRLEGNVIHDVYTLGYNGCGIYTDQASTGINIENNLVYDCKTSAFCQNFGKENNVHNNLFVNGMYQMFSGTQKEPHTSFYLNSNVIYYTRGYVCTEKLWVNANTVVDGNLYWHEGGELDFSGLDFEHWKAHRGQDMNSIVENPGFFDIENGDFRMKNISALERIGFRQFDYQKAGVFGDDKWIGLASYPHEKEFAEMVEWYENMLWKDLPYMRRLFLIDN